MEGFVTVDVVGVRVEMPSNSPIVLVRSPHDVLLPIWIGPNEAAAIAMTMQGVVPPRPLTHDLFVSTLRSLGTHLSSVRITRLSDGVFFAELVLDDQVIVDARPSDAIALALRASVPVMVADQVLDEAGIPVEEDAEVEDEAEEVERFREFLDQVTPDDFEQERP